jgi:hypothetical protein
MRIRIAAVIGASLALMGTLTGTGCPSTFGCDPPSKKFNMDEDLTTNDVASIMNDYGFSDVDSIDCEIACTYKFRQVDGWETSDVDSCSHQIDADATENPAGHVTCGGTAIEYYCEGRRPLGWVPQTSGGVTLVERLVELATLEAASIHSFEQLALRLEAWGAPHELVERCREAAEDERRHTQAVCELAHRRGWAGSMKMDTSGLADHVELVDEALHNAVEGCVAETWAALLAHVRARRAEDADVRAAYEAIAADETRHAQLAWDLHAWFSTRLDASERTRIEARRRAALHDLPARARIQAASLSPELAGLDPEEAARLAGDYASRLGLRAA